MRLPSIETWGNRSKLHACALLNPVMHQNQKVVHRDVAKLAIEDGH
jgi:hypothetical protein